MINGTAHISWRSVNERPLLRRAKIIKSTFIFSNSSRSTYITGLENVESLFMTYKTKGNAFEALCGGHYDYFKWQLFCVIFKYNCAQTRIHVFTLLHIHVQILYCIWSLKKKLFHDDLRVWLWGKCSNSFLLWIIKIVREKSHVSSRVAWQYFASHD